VGDVVVEGRNASINADLEENLSALGVNNTIDSPTLDSFGEGGEAILVMGFEYSKEIATALNAGEPVYAPVEGIIYPAHCAE
jgi:hypothetical protein